MKKDRFSDFFISVKFVIAIIHTFKSGNAETRPVSRPRQAWRRHHRIEAWSRYEPARDPWVRVSDVLGGDVRVGKLHLFGQRIIRAQGGEEGCGCQAAQGEQRRTIKKLSPVDFAVGVVVVEFEQFRGKIFRCDTVHLRASLWLIRGLPNIPDKTAIRIEGIYAQ
ncbi:hypothetical protein ACS73_05605 [Pseudomonas lini]|nr:hypothetical protein ACS73_05605 [Pseudomonas lini]